MITGAPYNGQANMYSIAAAYGVALYIGDPVISTGTASAGGIADVALAAATGPIRGVIVGLSDQAPGAAGLVTNPNLTYRPAAAQTGVWYAMVVDDPNVVFEVQENSNGTALAATDIGLNQVLKLGTGNGYVSGWMVASYSEATPNTTSTLQVRLLGLAQRQGNAFGAYAKHNVLINAHELRIGSDGK
tara:strand:- start:278 stop:841 length:564 start_codon:yes stop_codon:yes gene_type:complete